MEMNLMASPSSSSSSDGLRFRWWLLAVVLWMMLMILFSSSVVLLAVYEKSGNNNHHHNSHIISHDRHHHHHQRRRRLQEPQQQTSTAAAATSSANIFQQGCLQSILSGDDDSWTRRRRRKWRVCNSDDDDSFGSDSCRTPIDFVYPEMRIYAQQWESSIFAAWLLQIILSEMLDVPTTIETGVPTSSSSTSSQNGDGRRLSFYYDDDDSQNDAFQLVVANNNGDDDGGNSETGSAEKQALQHAIRYNQDCTLARRSGIDGSSSSSSNTNHNSTSSSEEGDVGVVEYYEPCAHYIPEIWKPATWMMQQQEEEMILQKDKTTTRLRLAPNGLVGQEGWFIPKFTAQRDPSLLSYLGLQGPANRVKLAETFLTPTTWQYYCDYIAPRRCNSNQDPVASRPPANTEEGARFFVPGGLYMGHFRRTRQNDCSVNSTTCTGHFASYPSCSSSWNSSSLPTTAQLHHLDIALQGNGMVDVDFNPSSNMARGYQISQLQELWLAANATKSNLIMTWFSPERTLFQEFLGTDAEMVRIVLPPATQQCLDDHRVESGVSDDRGDDRVNQCLADIQTRAGSSSPLGVCDYPVNPLQKLWLDTSSSSLLLSSKTAKTASAAALPASPAHYVFETFHLSNLQLDEMFDYWQRGKKKENGNNKNNNTATMTTSPRQAICQWAVDNIQHLESFIPESYPRVIAHQDDDTEKDNVYYSGLMYACTGVGAFAVVVIMITGFNVVDKKNQPVMQSAPLGFLFFILTGSLIVAMGAIVTGGFTPSNATCTAEIWLVNVGFTIGFVPLIYKLAAIQHSAKDHAKMERRVVPECWRLAEAVILASAIIMIILFLWTTYDPPRKSVASYQLTSTLTEEGETIVDVRYYCSSAQVFWQYLQIAWNLLLLLPAAALGFATANVPQDFNERAILTALVHCHILFVLLWLISLFLSPIVDETTLTGFRSMIFSIDSIFTMMIYVFPKFVVRVVRDPEPTSILDKDSEIPTSSSLSSGFSQPPLGPVARCIAYISGVSSCDGHKYQLVDSDDSALDAELNHAPVEMAAKTPRRNYSIGLNDDDEALVSQLRASVQQLEEERQELRSEVEKKNMAISMLEEEVGSLMEKLMGDSDSNVQNETADEMHTTARELQEEGRDLRSFLRSQDRSLKQLMSEEAKFLQKLESHRSVTDDKEAMWDAVWRFDKENAVNRLYTWDLTTDEEMETGEI